MEGDQGAGVGQLRVAVDEVAAAKVDLAHEKLVGLNLLKALGEGGANVEAALADALHHFLLALGQEGQEGAVDDLGVGGVGRGRGGVEKWMRAPQPSPL